MSGRFYAQSSVKATASNTFQRSTKHMRLTSWRAEGRVTARTARVRSRQRWSLHRELARRGYMNKTLTLTMRAAAEATGLSVRTLYNLIAQKKLQSVTVGRRRLIVAKSLEELLLGKAE